MVVCWFLNKFLHTEWSTGKINDFFSEAVSKKLILSDGSIQNYNGIYLLGGLKVEYLNEHSSPDKICQPDEFEHLEWFWNESHFTAGNGNGILTYDPMGESQTAKNGYLKSKRIFRRL